MASSVVRRPLPALVALLALLLLTGIVWWRVISRDESGGQPKADCPSPKPTSSATTQLPDPSDVTLTMLNSTSYKGLAARVRTKLVERGFNIPNAAGNDKPKTKITSAAQIRFGPQGKDAASLVRYYLPGATLVPVASKSANVVVSLGTGYKGVASADDVKKALAGDKVSVASPSPSSTAGSTSSADC